MEIALFQPDIAGNVGTILRTAACFGAHGIIHAGPLERGVAERKTAGFDDMRRRAETGGGAQDRADIAGDVGLEQGDFHCASIKPKAPRIEGLGRVGAAG